MYKNNLYTSEAQKNINSDVRRFDIINYLIDKYKFLNYLEIGVFQGENIKLIKADHKTGIDPGDEGHIIPEVTYPMTSDDFFELIKDCEDIKYDVIFIDGLHHVDQVDKDITNSLKHVVEGGFIVLHDCNPISFESQKTPRETVIWNGDVWKSFVKFKFKYPMFKTCVIDTDFGVGIIRKCSDYRESLIEEPILTWEYFDSNRKRLLNLVTVEEFKQIF